MNPASSSASLPSEPVTIPALGQFSRTDFAEIRQAFRDAPEWKFGQSWREKRERHFRGGAVRIGWRGDRLLIFAKLSDRNVFSSATGRNQELWKLGDVLEVFAGITGEPRYIEYHIAPNGAILQLFWPDSEALKRAGLPPGLNPFLRIDNEAFLAARAVRGGWEAYAEIPSAALGATQGKSLANKIWDLSFGRYDYSEPGGKPVLSCTSPLTVAAYHRRAEWQRVRFVDSQPCRQSPKGF